MPTMNTRDESLTDQLPGILKALLWPTVAASIGSAATQSGVKSWYPKLDKPDFNPPG